MEIRAAVLHRKGEKFKIETVTLDEPQAGEVLVRIVASGICLTDIHVQNQEYWFPLPAVLGHEGAGIVEKAGKGVSAVKPGDHVVLGYAYCGKCRPCLAGAPFECERYDELNFGGRMADGSTRLHQGGRELSVFFGQSSFATHAVVSVNNVVKVDEKLDLKLLGPLGCGVQTGSGTVLNHFQAEAGSSIAVFGAGAVGLSAVMAAKIAGCRNIVAVDIHDNRLELARELGATHVLNSRKVDVVAEIKRITGGGAEYALEASGRAAVGRQAVESLVSGGKLAYVSAPPFIPGIDPSHLGSLTINGIVEGDSIPQVFIPRLIDLYKESRPVPVRQANQILSYGRNQSSRCRRSKQHCRQTGYHYALVQIRKPAGKYNPSLKLAYDIARVFRASIEEIFVFVEKAGNRPPHES